MMVHANLAYIKIWMHTESLKEERVLSQVCRVYLVIAYHTKTVQGRNDQDMIREESFIQRNAKFVSWKWKTYESPACTRPA